MCLYLWLKIDDEEGEIARYLDTEEVRWGGSMEWNPKPACRKAAIIYQ